MTGGLPPVLLQTRRPRWSCLVLATALVAGACSDDGDDASSSTPPVATVHEVEIFESDVEALASDPGFLSFIGAPEPDDSEDVSQTEAGRRTLTWLIGRALIDSELAVQDLAVDDETLDQAADDLRGGDVPDEAAETWTDDWLAPGPDAHPRTA